MLDYKVMLRKYNLKATAQRLGILSLIDQNGHISVEELFTHIKKEFEFISLATLYKNIHAMLKNRLIIEVKIPNEKSKYEISKDPHIHLLCQKCKEFIDMRIDLQELLTEVSHKSSYKLNSSSIVLSGECKRCQDKY